MGYWAQSSAPGWGWRDLAWDGTYLYGADSNAMAIIDPLAANPGQQIGTINIIGPPAFPRALAYNEDLDIFYGGNFGSAIYSFNRQGNVLQTAPFHSTAAYGMAYDSDAPDGPWLWIHDQTGPTAKTLHKYDPATLTYTGFSQVLPLLGFSSSDMAGGLAYSPEWDPPYSSMIAFSQSSPNDGMGGYEMYMLEPNVPAACQDFLVANNGADLLATLSWMNPSLNVGGLPLAELLGVLVTRDGVQVYDLTDVAIGMPYALNDPVPEAGGYSYVLTPYNSWGNGATASAGAWIGLDVCGPVGNFAAVPDPGGGLECTLTWDDPTAGAHTGAYWPAGSFDSFTIYRDGAEIATGVTGNTYVDNPASHGWYDYGIAAINASGTGVMVEHLPVYVGPPEMLAIPYDWVEISGIGTNSGVTGDDQNLGPFPLGTVCPFYNNEIFTQFRICSNGFLSWTSTSTSYVNYAIPTAAEPNNLIAPFWDDLYPPGGGTIWYMYDEVNDRCIIEYDNVMSFASPQTPQKFEAFIYGDGTFEYMYNLIQAPCINTSTVGIENAAGTIGVQSTYNGSGPLEPASGTGIRIMPVGEIVIYNATIELDPAVTPVQIPAIGGSFDFDITVTNLETFQIPMIQGWIMVELPTGAMYGPVLGPTTISPAAGAIITRTRTQYVPGSAPTGNYDYIGRLGYYPSVVMSESGFPFEKLATGDGAWVASWENWGEDLTSEPESMVEMPSTHVLYGAHPNPFNPATTISFYLNEAAEVKLAVYDVTGRLVSTLIDGYRNAGPQEVQFNANDLSSGIYFYHLTAGNFTAAKKMILLK
ncbi:T9SS type A sorting domain-containing protein [bacterium]|nr:T9SS type A sorting domain-containing protein [bacterium]